MDLCLKAQKLETSFSDTYQDGSYTNSKAEDTLCMEQQELVICVVTWQAQNTIFPAAYSPPETQ